MTDTIAGLRAARALVQKGWTQGAYAVNAEGESVHEKYSGAVRWCVMGACWAIRPSGIARLLRPLKREAPYGLGAWNDAPDRTQDDVLQLFDRTIARLEAEAGR